MVSTNRQSENLALARRFFEYFVAGDTERWLEMLDPEIRSRPSIDGAPALDGREEVSEWWTRFSASDGDIETRTLDYELAGDCVIVRGYQRQREGRVLSERQVFWLYEFHDGLVVRMESHPTRNSALAACN